MIVGLVFKFRGSCIYIWVSVNLNLSEIPGLLFLFLLSKYQSPLLPPLSLSFPLTDKSVFDEKKKIIPSAVPAFVS